MFANESPRTWVGLGLYGASALILLGCKLYPPHWRDISVFGADLLVLSGILVSLPAGGVNRKISEVYEDFKSGKRKPTTVLQKVCAVLGVFLVIASTIADYSL